MLHGVAAWKTELAALVSRRANGELRWGGACCADWTNSWPSTTNLVAAVYSAASASEASAATSTMSERFSAVWVTRAIARGAV